MFALARFVKDDPWWVRISDDVSHILVGVCHGRCVRASEGGLEMSVLEDVNTWSVAGSGCESFQGVRCTRFVNGDCPWDLSLGQRSVGKRQPQDTYIRVVFAGRHTLSNRPIFYVICYTLSSGGFTASCFKTITNGVPESRCSGKTRVR